VGGPAYLASDQDDGGTGAGKLTATPPVSGVIAEIGVVKDNTNYFSNKTAKVLLELQRIVVGAPFTSPLNLTNLKLWLRADRANVTLSTNQVTQWNDTSGNGNNATQGTSANRPTWNSSDANFGGRPSLSFSGTQAMSLASLFPNQPFTVYVVARTTNSNPIQALFADTTNAVGIFIGTSIGLNWTISAALTSSNGTVNTTLAFCAVYNSQLNQPGSILYINSSAKPVQGPLNIGTANPAGTEIIGGATAAGGDGLVGAMAEVIVVGAAHSQTQTAQVFNYLSQYYNLPYVA